MESKDENNSVDFVKNPIDRLLDTGLLFEINRKILHPFGMALASADDGVMRLVEAKNDPEGFVYDEEFFISSSKKFAAFFEEQGEGLLSKRKSELGYIVQNYPDPLVKVNGLSILMQEGEDGIHFKVPYDWARTSIREWFDWSVEEFGRHHGNEQAHQIYVDAKESGVIIFEEKVDS